MSSDGSEIQRAQAPVRGARKIFEPRTLESFTSCNQRSLCTKVCLQNARLPSAQILQFWKCAPEEDVQACEVRAEMFDSGEDVKGVVHYQGLSYVPEIIRTELISRHHDEGTLASRRRENSLRTSSLRYFSSGIHSGHFGIETIRELVARKYYAPAVATNIY